MKTTCCASGSPCEIKMKEALVIKQPFAPTKEIFCSVCNYSIPITTNHEDVMKHIRNHYKNKHGISDWTVSCHICDFYYIPSDDVMPEFLPLKILEHYSLRHPPGDGGKPEPKEKKPELEKSFEESEVRNFQVHAM